MLTCIVNELSSLWKSCKWPKGLCYCPATSGCQGHCPQQCLAWTVEVQQRRPPGKDNNLKYIYGSGHETAAVLLPGFCYQLIAKPGYKTATVPWPDPYSTCLKWVSCKIKEFRTTSRNYGGTKYLLIKYETLLKMALYIWAYIHARRVIRICLSNLQRKCNLNYLPYNGPYKE